MQKKNLRKYIEITGVWPQKLYKIIFFVLYENNIGA